MKDHTLVSEKWDLRGLIAGISVGIALAIGVAWFWQSPGAAQAQQPAPDPRQARIPGGELMVFALPGKEGQQQVTVVDPRQRVIGLYLLDSTSGEISLKGVRRIDGDLMMEEFNSTSPTPREIRAILQR